MATLASSCDSCIEAKIPHCADLYQVCGVLTADTEYTSVITDRFGKKHILTDVTDADGIWTIDPADYPDGFFSQHGGPKVLQFYTDQNLCDLVTISIGDPAVDYTCISLKVFEASEEQATWDVLCLCEEVTPPPPDGLYYYHMMIEYADIDADLYNGVNINGTEYLDWAGNGIGQGPSFLAQDLLAAGFTIGTTSDCGGLVGVMEGGPSHIYWWAITNQPATITLHLTVRGTPFDRTLVGGELTAPYSKSSGSIAIADVGQNYGYLYLNVPDEVGGTASFEYNVAGIGTAPFNTYWPSNPIPNVDGSNICGRTSALTDLGGGNYNVEYTGLPADLTKIVIASSPFTINLA